MQTTTAQQTPNNQSLQQPQSISEIDSDLHNRLVKCGVLKPGAKSRGVSDNLKKTLIDIEASQLFESGIALSKYLVCFKEALYKRGIELNIDSPRLQSLKHLLGPQTKLFNWNIITHELDKIGVKTDGVIKTYILGGDQESIMKLFKQAEQSIVKLQKGGLDIDELMNEFGYTVNQDGLLVRQSTVGKLSKKRTAREGVDILTMKVDKDPSETESSLELILNTLCRAFQMKPKQAAALLTNNNQFLIHSIVKGVKGNYEPLIAWYTELKIHLKHLVILLDIETEQLPKLQNVPKVLGTLASGLYSQNVDICRHSFELLNMLNQEFSQSQMMFKQAHTWVVDKDGGLELTLQALKRHSLLAGDFINFVTTFSTIMKQTIDRVYKDEFRKLFEEPHDYISVINDILPHLVQHQYQAVRDSGILDYWIDLALEQGGIDQQKTADERIAAITLLAEIWFSFTEYVQSKSDRLEMIQQILKKGCRDRQNSLRITAVSLMFTLLDKFAEEKNTSAPALYKSLIFSLIENPGDIFMREHYFINFSALFEQQQSIPLKLLLDPLLKQISISENVTYFYKIFDFEFFQAVARHPKLTTSTAIPLVDLLGRVYLNDVVLASAAAGPLVYLCSRFNLEMPMQDFIVRFETVCLTNLLNLEKDAEELQKQHQKVIQEREMAKQQAAGKKPLAIEGPPPEFQHKHGKPTKRMTKEEQSKLLKQQEQEAVRRLKKSQIIQVLLKLQNLKHEGLNEQLKALLLSTNRRFYQDLYGYYHKGIMTLLRYWGDSDILMKEYTKDIEEAEEQERRDLQERELQAKQEKESRDKEERYQMTMKRYGDEMQRLRASINNGAILSGDEERKLSLWEEEGQADLTEIDLMNPRDSMGQLMLYQGGAQSRLNEATMRNQKAQMQIAKIQRIKIEQEEQKRIDEERKKLQSERRRQKLKEVIDQRKFEHGVAPKSQALQDSQDMPLLKESMLEQEPERQKNQKLIQPNIKLINLDEEEDRDKEAVQLVMKKYTKLWKNLYYKYSNSGFNPKNVSNFDQYNERSETISIGEMTKLLRDHNAFPSLIKKDELQTLFRLVNTKLNNRQELQDLDYPSYLSFMLQLAYFCFTKEPKNLSHLPPVETVIALIKHFEDATRSRGHSTILYEDPDATSAADSKLIKALNEKLSSDPQYPIPEGYIKQLEKTPIYDYKVPESIASQMKQAQVVAIEVLDSILNEKFGIHILEPFVQFEERLKVKPQIKSNAGQLMQQSQAEALNYMRKVEKKIKPAEQSLNPYASMSALEKLKLNQEVKPELNTTLKLQVAQFPIKDRAHVQEVAEVLEEILQASEKGLLTLPPRLNRAPGQVYNDAKKKREEDQKREHDIKFNKEDKRKKRDGLLKNELVKLKEQKEKEEQEAKKKAVEDERLKKEKQKKYEETVKKRLEQQKSEALQAQDKKEAEEKKKKEAEEAKAGTKKKVVEIVDPVKLRTERKEYMKRQRERLSMQFEKVAKDREEVAKKEEIVSQKEMEFKQKIRASMEAYVKEIAPDRGKEQRERVQIKEFLNQEEVIMIFDRFNQALRQMFRFYASQDKKDVGFNLEKSMNSMNLRELIRFAYQQFIIPTLVQPEDIVQIFRQLMREKQDELTQQLVDPEDNYLVDKNFAQIIDFDQFKGVLVRIATLAASDQHKDGINAKLENEIENKKKSKKRGGNKDLSEEAKAKEDAFMDQMDEDSKKRGSIGKAAIASQRSRSSVRAGAPLKSHTVDKTPQKQVDAQKPGENGAIMLNALTNSLRMSKEVMILRGLQQKEQLGDKILAQAKIDKDRKVRKDFNVSLIQAKTIEALLRFLELEPEEKPQSLDQKLNQHRIEIQGQKPTRIKKQIKNNRLEDYLQQEQIEGSQISPSRLEDGEVIQENATLEEEAQQ